MHNALTDILNVDSYAEKLTKEYEMRKEEILRKKNREIQSADENFENSAEKLRSYFNSDLEIFEKNNSRILEEYQRTANRMKENYAEKKGDLLEILVGKLLDSDNGQL